MSTVLSLTCLWPVYLSNAPSLSRLQPRVLEQRYQYQKGRTTSSRTGSALLTLHYLLPLSQGFGAVAVHCLFQTICYVGKLSCFAMNHPTPVDLCTIRTTTQGSNGKMRHNLWYYYAYP